MSSQKTTLILQGLLAAATLAIAIPFPEFAQAQNLAATANTLHSGMANLPNIVSGAFYIGGASMIGAGSLKLKAHSENPTNTPLGHGLGRIGAGSALIALPAFGTWLNNSLAVGNTAATSQGFGTVQ